MLGWLRRRFMPYVCSSLTYDSRSASLSSSCWAEVQAPNERCDSCWDSLVNADDPQVRMLVAIDPDISSAHAVQLAKDSTPIVTRAMASQEDLKKDAAMALADNPKEDVRLILAETTVNPHVQAKLAADKSKDVVLTLLSNSSLGPQVLRSIAENNPDEMLQTQAQARLNVISEMPIIAGT